MRKYLLLVSVVSLLFSCKSIKTNKTGEPWVNLLEGNSLKNWTVKIRNHKAGENYKNTFRVKDGVLAVNYGEYEKFDDSFGHIFYNKEYSNYKFRMDYRFIGDQIEGGAAWALRNSGIMIHCEAPENMGLQQKFPVSIEVQLLGGNGTDERPTANVCTPGTHVDIDGKQDKTHCITSSSETFHGEQWVHIEIEVRNSEIVSHKINGKEVLSYTNTVLGGAVDANKTYWKNKEGELLKKGYISLQSESHPIEFKNIQILEL
ncbi:3-keto-disaccharide hydrolase [Flavicella sediminum]|uniref:3-keto-disaccharide hydrolase n=1 Tax=Flavicella sediminum TaxID=2585141 RepID=UPI00111EC2BC|nr:DUF1080 domain-containing protein [Flavicella sediminum]